MIRLIPAAVLTLLLLVVVPASTPSVVEGAATAPASSTSSQVPPIVYRERTLPNGMKVYFSLDRTTPNVSVQVWYRVGARTIRADVSASPTSLNT